MLVGIEIVKEEVIVFDAVLQVIHNLLLFVNLYSETSPLIEDILIIVHIIVGFASEAATARQYKLSLTLKRVLNAGLTHCVLLGWVSSELLLMRGSA